MLAEAIPPTVQTLTHREAEPAVDTSPAQTIADWTRPAPSGVAESVKGLVTRVIWLASHSEKELAAPNFKRGFGLAVEPSSATTTEPPPQDGPWHNR